MKILSEAEVLRAASLPALIDELRSALRGRERTASQVPQRTLITRAAPFAVFGAMPVHSETHGLFVTKLACLVPATSEQQRSVNSLVVAFSALDGRPVAVLDGVAVTNLRCAAVTAVVTDACADQGASTLALIGTGTQGWQQWLGVSSVRPLSHVRVFSRRRAGAERFANQLRTSTSGRVSVEVTDSAESAVKDASIISIATTSSEPVVLARALPSDVHVNCCGAHTTTSRELPHEVLAGSRLFVEDRPTAVAEAGPLHEHAFELEQLWTEGPPRPRGTRSVFSSTGHAFLDLLATAHILRRAGVYAAPAGAVLS